MELILLSSADSRRECARRRAALHASVCLRACALVCVCVCVCSYGTESKGKVTVVLTNCPLKFAGVYCGRYCVCFCCFFPPKPAVKSAAFQNLKSCFQIDTLLLDPSSLPSLCHLFEQGETVRAHAESCVRVSACTVVVLFFFFHPFFLS